jgi:chromosome segregation ATPase
VQLKLQAAEARATDAELKLSRTVQLKLQAAEARATDAERKLSRTVQAERAVTSVRIESITKKHKKQVSESLAVQELQKRDMQSLQSEVTATKKQAATEVAATIGNFRQVQEAEKIKLFNERQSLKRKHSEAVKDKNKEIVIIKRTAKDNKAQLRTTIQHHRVRELNLKKDVRTVSKKVATAEQTNERLKLKADETAKQADELRTELENKRDESEHLQNELKKNRALLLTLEGKVDELEHDCAEGMEEILVCMIVCLCYIILNT